MEAKSACLRNPISALSVPTDAGFDLRGTREQRPKVHFYFFINRYARLAHLL